MDCLNCGNYATRVYVNDEGTPCFLCTSCADAWELGHWYGQNYPESTIARIEEYCDMEETVSSEPFNNQLSQPLNQPTP